MSHPCIKDILTKWDETDSKIRLDEGYIPDKKEILLDIEEEEKEGALSHHSEKLAIAFALINTSDNMHIRIVKNLRVCHDCHHVTKLISKVYGRDTSGMRKWRGSSWLKDKFLAKTNLHL